MNENLTITQTEETHMADLLSPYPDTGDDTDMEPGLGYTE
jgi:hypothetical protein